MNAKPTTATPTGLFENIALLCVGFVSLILVAIDWESRGG